MQEPALGSRWVGADGFLVGLDAPSGGVGHDEVSVLELRLIGEQLAIPGQPVGVAAAKCAFIIVARWP